MRKLSRTALAGLVGGIVVLLTAGPAAAVTAYSSLVKIDLNNTSDIKIQTKASVSAQTLANGTKVVNYYGVGYRVMDCGAVCFSLYGSYSSVTVKVVLYRNGIATYTPPACNVTADWNNTILQNKTSTCQGPLAPRTAGATYYTRTTLSVKWSGNASTYTSTVNSPSIYYP